MDMYLLIASKFVVGFIFSILQINILGKHEFSTNSPINQIQNYILGGIIGGVIFNQGISLLTLVIILLIWSLVVILVKLLINNRWIKSIVVGNPVIIIKNGIINVENCTKVGLTADQLLSHIRAAGLQSSKDVKSAIMEANGDITILDMHAQNPKFPLISNGQINTDVLDLIGRNEAWLLGELSKQGYHLKDIYLAEYFDGQVTLAPYIIK